jgi:hypothetical protein
MQHNTQKADAVLIVSLARDLKNKFKALCAERGITMTDEVVGHVREQIKNEKVN